MSVLLLGASGLAREVIAAGAPGIVGVLDDDPTMHGTECGGVPVLGGIAEAVTRRADHLLLCVGPGRARREVAHRLAAAGVGADRYATFVAADARIGATSTVGGGSILLDGATITAEARVGRHVVVMPGCTIGHDDLVADFATFAAGVSLGGGVRIGEAAFLGLNASVHPGVAIGADATVGMGAAVIRDVPDGETWVGVPARPLLSSGGIHPISVLEVSA
ncbi:NeuD/PglB/VioB family sugar acetyltransferase [Microbacterium rhizophilus]|uniref:NeuD/PglB/VioB family sugar acetyltransferase n=1 Tax=Microbacterium rhizophilus TaxID=3138934 RepID=UPI0031EC0BF2